VPVVGVTGNALESEQKEFLDAGAVAVLPKPVDVLRLDGLLTELGVIRPDMGQ